MVGQREEVAFSQVASLFETWKDVDYGASLLGVKS